MRAGVILSSLVLLLFTGCKMALPGGDAAAGQGLVTEEISVQPLDAAPPAAGSEAEALAEPPLDPAAQPEAEPAEDAPEAAEAESEDPEAAEPEEEAAPDLPKTPQQLDCEGRGGLWTPAGETGAFLCLSPTGDAGKTCRRESDCDGQCLARSNTCAPYKPLFGCNEILDKDGRRMTLCID